MIETNSAREAWNTSTEKAKELKPADWGTPEEFANMAKMPRTAQTITDAKPILETIKENGFISNKYNPILKVSLSNTSIKKILNNKAKNQSFDEAAHLLAAVNIDKLFFNAIELWKFELDPRKQNEQIRERKFLYAPMEYNKIIYPVKLTVIEYQNNDVNLYSLEAIQVVLA